MVFAVANSRIAAEAVRPNPKIWGHKRAKGFALSARAAIADFAQTKTAYALAGNDIGARLIMGEVVLDQVLTACISLEKAWGSPAMIEMRTFMLAHTPGGKIQLAPATSQAEIDFTVEKLGEENVVAPSVWQLT